MYDQIPVEILELHEGQWTVWDQDARKVLGATSTLDEAEDQADRCKTNHLLRIHHVLPRDSEISGML